MFFLYISVASICPSGFLPSCYCLTWSFGTFNKYSICSHPALLNSLGTQVNSSTSSYVMYREAQSQHDSLSSPTPYNLPSPILVTPISLHTTVELNNHIIPASLFKSNHHHQILHMPPLVCVSCGILVQVLITPYVDHSSNLLTCFLFEPLLLNLLGSKFKTVSYGLHFLCGS